MSTRSEKFQLLQKFWGAFVALILYSIFMVTTCFINMRFFDVDVVLYSSILSSLVAAAIASIIIWKFAFFNCFEAFEKFLLVNIFMLIGYAFSITVPTIIDRSFTLYMLEQLRSNEGGVIASQFESEITKRYIQDYQLVPLRITEQLKSGTIYIDANNCVKLTHLGHAVATATHHYRQTFLPRSRLVNGIYTDKLVYIPSDSGAQSKCQ